MRIIRTSTVLAIIFLSILPLVFLLGGCGGGGGTGDPGAAAINGGGQLKVSMAMRFVGPDKSIASIPSNATGDISISLAGPSFYRSEAKTRYENSYITFENVNEDGTYSVSARAVITYPSENLTYSFYGTSSSLIKVSETAEIFVELMQLYPTKINFEIAPPTSKIAGAKLDAFSVKVLDQYNNFLATAAGTVTAKFIDAAGTVVGSSYTAEVKNGAASFSDVSAPSASGQFKLTVSYAGVSDISTDFSATALVLTSVAFYTQPSSAAQAGTVLPDFSVRLLDQLGNIMSGASDYVTIAFVDASGNSISGAAPVTVQAVSGLASFSGVKVPEFSGAVKIKAVSGTITPVFSNLISVTVVVIPVASSLSLMTPIPASLEGGSAYPSLQVNVLDQNGNTYAASSGIVTAELVDQSGNLISGTEAITASVASGVATFSGIVPNVSVTAARVRFTMGNLTPIYSTNFNIVKTAGAATKIVWITPPVSELTSGQPLPKIVVEFRDANGMIVTGGPFVTTLTLVNKATLTPVTLASGNFTGQTPFENIIISAPAGLYTLSVNSSGLVSASADITIKSVSATHIVWITPPVSELTSGQPLPKIVAEFRDANSLPVTGSPFAATLTLLSQATSESVTLTSGNFTGQATFENVIITAAAGLYTLSVNSSGLVSASSNINIKAAGPVPTKLAWAIEPTPRLIVGTYFSAVASVTDTTGAIAESLNTGEIGLKITGPTGTTVLDTVGVIIAGRGFFAGIPIPSSWLPGSYTITATSALYGTLSYVSEVVSPTGMFSGMNMFISTPGALYNYNDSPFSRWQLPFTSGIRLIKGVHPKNATKDKLFVLETSNKITIVSNINSNSPSVAQPYDLSGSLPDTSYKIVSFAPSQNGNYLYLAVQPLSSSLNQLIIRWDISSPTAALSIDTCTSLGKSADVSNLLEYSDGRVYAASAKNVIPVNFTTLDAYKQGTTEAAITFDYAVNGMDFYPGGSDVIVAEVNGTQLHKISNGVKTLSVSAGIAALSADYNSFLSVVDHTTYGPKAYVMKSYSNVLQSYIFSDGSMNNVVPSNSMTFDYPQGTIISQVTTQTLFNLTNPSGVFSPSADKLVITNGSLDGFVRYIDLINYTTLDYVLRDSSNAKLAEINGIVIY